MKNSYTKALIAITTGITVATLISAASATSTASATSATSALEFPTDGKTKAIIKLDAYHNGQKIGSTNIPEGREVKVATETSTHYKVELNESTHGWVKKEDIEVLDAPTPSISPTPIAMAEKGDDENVVNLVEVEGADLKAIATPTKDEASKQKSPSNDVLLLDIKVDASNKTSDQNLEMLQVMINYVGTEFPISLEFLKKLKSPNTPLHWGERELINKNLGLIYKAIYTNDQIQKATREEKEALAGNIINSLESGEPLDLESKDGMGIIFGYDKSTQKLYVWSPERKRNSQEVTSSLPDAPEGTYTINMSRLPSVAKFINVLKNKRSYGNKTEKSYLAKLLDIKNSRKINPYRFYVRSDGDTSAQEGLGKRILPTIIEELHNKGKVIIIPQGYDAVPYTTKEVTGSVLKVTPTGNGGYKTTQFPSNTDIELSIGELVKNIVANGNRYYTAPQ
jgi:hypothetical protein